MAFAPQLSEQGGAAVEDFLATEAGQALLSRADTGYAARFADGMNSIMLDALKTVGGLFGQPAAEARSAANSASQLIVGNATDLALKATISALDATEPLVAAMTKANTALVSPLAALGEQLAGQMRAKVLERAAQMPEALQANLLGALAASDEAAAAFEEQVAAGEEAVTMGA